MIVFTNGCFDILHAGHIDLLERAKAYGTKLIVGINGDESVRAIKGTDRPINDQESRKAVLLALEPVDEVIIFDELTPENLIKNIKPDVLVKGGDWKVKEIIGGDFVSGYGGKVLSLPLKDGYSTTNIVHKIRENKQPAERNSDSVIGVSLKQHVDVFRAILDSNTASIES